MFEDITEKKKEMIKSALGYDVSTELNAEAITQKIIRESKYFTEAVLRISTNNLKNCKTKIIFTKGDELYEFIIGDEDTLKITHTFNVTK